MTETVYDGLKTETDFATNTMYLIISFTKSDENGSRVAYAIHNTLDKVGSINFADALNYAIGEAGKRIDSDVDAGSVAIKDITPNGELVTIRFDIQKAHDLIISGNMSFKNTDITDIKYKDFPTAVTSAIKTLLTA